jgi:hypothetical protein
MMESAAILASSELMLIGLPSAELLGDRTRGVGDITSGRLTLMVTALVAMASTLFLD